MDHILARQLFQKTLGLRDGGLIEAKQFHSIWERIKLDEIIGADSDENIVRIGRQVQGAAAFMQYLETEVESAKLKELNNAEGND